MSTVQVRNVVLGDGIPKICVPIVAVTRENILEEAKSFLDIPVDLVEWRVDWFEDVFELEKVKDTLAALREVLGEIPILFTFRTAKEGGEREISKDDYATLNKEIAKTRLADLIDVEAFTGDDIVKDIIAAAHENEVKIVGSNHDFDKTPAEEDIIYRLRKMQDLGADIPKIAVMPKSKLDVLTLLSATEKMRSFYANCPIITMSMAGTGVISRICGEVFGSCLTFGAAKKASAPGQMGVEDLTQVLSLLHKSL